ncbi:hypothetical protein AQPE_1534 [Aquipluma nitroreducens]|uniref:Uncharacterized protein n=1 Tax=Aquipluma nitroreducens TaxID=2010828 RepID=A0A5K7S7T6_9BACT|nr:hypothetical protein AQPE_1534 [Aquipluma nitroreducens]
MEKPFFCDLIFENENSENKKSRFAAGFFYIWVQFQIT